MEKSKESVKIKNFEDSEDLNLAISGLSEGEQAEYISQFKKQMEDYGFVFDKATNTFVGDNVEYKYDDSLSEQENENRKKAFDQLKQQDRHVDFISTQIILIVNILYLMVLYYHLQTQAFLN